MYTLRRFAPHLYAFLVFIAFAWMNARPDDVFGIIQVQTFEMPQMLSLYLFLAFFLMLTVFGLGAGKPFSSKIRFSIFPHLFLASSYFFFLISDHPTTLTALMILVPVILWFWFENIYLFWQRTDQYQAYTLERLASYFYVLLVFIFAYSLTGAQVLMQISFWIVLFLFVGVIGLLLFDLLQLHKFDPMESFTLSIIGVTLAAQLMFSLSILPAHFLLVSISIALFFYFWAGMCKLILSRSVTLKGQVTYITIASIGFVSVFVSSLLLS